MAVKTITIDMEAYAVLSRLKRGGQSFSDVIKERLGPVRTGRDLAAALEGLRPADSIITSIDAVVQGRQRHKVRGVEL